MEHLDFSIHRELNFLKKNVGFFILHTRQILTIFHPCKLLVTIQVCRSAALAATLQAHPNFTTKVTKDTKKEYNKGSRDVKM